MQALWFSLVDVIAPFVKTSQVRVADAARYNVAVRATSSPIRTIASGSSQGS